jgi:hypothetical protein
VTAQTGLDPLAPSRALLAEYDAMTARDRNYRSSMYAGLLAAELRVLVASLDTGMDQLARQAFRLGWEAGINHIGHAEAWAIAEDVRRRHRLRVVK